MALLNLWTKHCCALGKLVSQFYLAFGVRMKMFVSRLMTVLFYITFCWVFCSLCRRLQQHILVDHPSAGDIAAIIRRQATRHMPCEVVEKEPATEINRSNNSSACSSHCNESSKEEDATVNVTALAAQLIAAKASALPTCADVEHFCNRARRRALLEYIELSQGHQNSNDAVGEMPKKRVTQKHFQAVLAEMTK